MADDLQDLLVARKVGTGAMRLQRQLHPSKDANEWQGVDQAMALLPDSVADTMPHIAIESRYLAPPGSPQASRPPSMAR